MLIRNVFVIMCLMGTALLSGVQTAAAFDPDKVFAGNEQPNSILKYGFNALRDGRTNDAISAFRHGAKKNHIPSQWKLARMLQQGQGAPRDQLAAYRLFEKIALRFSDIPPSRNDRPYVSDSVVSLGVYSLHGIENTEVVVNPFVAEHHFLRAASLYGNAEAQYQLGNLYASELLGSPRPRSAARWYGLASRKGHVQAQAQLGDMLFKGHGVRKNPVKGLVYLTTAVKRSAKGGLQRIRVMRQAAFSKASAAQRFAASKIVDKLFGNAKPANIAAPDKTNLPN